MSKHLIKTTVAALLLSSSFLSFSSVAFGASTSVDQSVNQVKAELNKSTTFYVYPALEGEIVSSKSLYPVLNSAKKNYQNAINVIQSSKLSQSEKQSRLNELEDLYNDKVAKGLVPYIDAYNYATKYLEPLLAEIKAAEAKNDYAAVEKAYHKLSYQLKGRSAILYRFSGKASRDLLLEKYKQPSDQKRDELVVPVTIYMKIVEVEKLVKDGKLEEAKKVLESIEALVDRLPNADSSKFLSELVKAVEKVQEVVEPTNPTSPTTPPVSGGGGGGFTPNGNDLLNSALLSSLEAGNSAANGSVNLTLNGKGFIVSIKEESSTLGDFKLEAQPIFDAFKTNTVVNSATVSYTTSSGKVTIASDNVNNNQDFETVIGKALEAVGLSETAELSILNGKSITIEVQGTINSSAFNDAYTFTFTK